MLMITVQKTDPRDADARYLIDASEAELNAIYPPEDNFALSVDALADQDVWFAVARLSGQPVGCGGLARYAGYGELKRIYVAPPARGKGVAHRILAALEDEAGRQNLPVVRLETGAELKASLALYHSRGYRPCAVFGDYPDNGASLFLEKRL